jgi:hypothetical protein
MRAKAAGRFRPDGWHKGYAMGRFAAAPGRRWAAAGLAYPGGGRLGCTLLAAWEPGHAEPWLLLTDLPPGAANPAWYAWRMWVEQGFRAIKGGQWQWQRTRMTDPARAARLWAVLALASVWAVEVGGAGEAAAVPEVPRRLGALRAGLLRLLLALLRGEPLPRGRLEHHPWPQADARIDPLSEPLIDQC